MHKTGDGNGWGGVLFGLHGLPPALHGERERAGRKFTCPGLTNALGKLPCSSIATHSNRIDVLLKVTLNNPWKFIDIRLTLFVATSWENNLQRGETSPSTPARTFECLDWEIRKKTWNFELGYLQETFSLPDTFETIINCTLVTPTLGLSLSLSLFLYLPIYLPKFLIPYEFPPFARPNSNFANVLKQINSVCYEESLLKLIFNYLLFMPLNTTTWQALNTAYYNGAWRSSNASLLLLLLRTSLDAHTRWIRRINGKLLMHFDSARRDLHWRPIREKENIKPMPNERAAN